MYLTKTNSYWLISFPASILHSSHKPQSATLATVHRKKSSKNFVVHVAEVILI